MESNTPSHVRTAQFFPVFMSIAVLTVSLVFYGVMDFGMQMDQSANTNTNVLGASTVLHTATVRVNDNVSTRTYQSVTFESGDSAYDLLLNAREQTTFDFEGELYDFGYYIHTINGRRSLNNEYWKFVLNGVDSTVRMEEYKVKDGDVVEFVLERF